MMLVNEWRHNLYENPELRNIFLEVTSRCNARCEHCGSRCDGNKQGEEISVQEINKALKEVAEHYDPRKITLHVTGREPLMRRDLFDILDYASSIGYNWGMATNGMLITDKIIKKMEEDKMYSCSISIDGLKNTHELFRKVPNCYDIKY